MGSGARREARRECRVLGVRAGFSRPDRIKAGPHLSDVLGMNGDLSL